MSEILSVGIDIGTTTTQVIFSRITIDNTASYFSVPKISVLDKKIIYRSQVHITPLINQVLIDGDKVRELVSGEFKKAGYVPRDVDTGAVIITGEAARKENAQTVLASLSDFAGDFVVSTAGPDLESVISGKGSGAFKYSLDNMCSVMNLDIGGGTTNGVCFESGQISGKYCLDIGGRQIRLGDNYTVEYISPSAQLISEYLGISLHVGEKTDQDTIFKITDQMAQLLAEGAGLAPASTLLEKIRTRGSSTWVFNGHLDKICFSGGVADCISSQKSQDYLVFGDIGLFLGQSIRRNSFFANAEKISAQETIRATVVGAGTYTMTLSGSTISYSPDIFPLKNVPVMKVSANAENEIFSGDNQLLSEEIDWFQKQHDSKLLIIAIRGKHNPSYYELENAGKVVLFALDRALSAEMPVIVISQEDIAKALGLIMKNLRSGRKIATIDSVIVDDGDFLDIGSPLMDGLVVPVVVKTLLFG